MRPNVGGLDRIGRAAVALVMLVVGYRNRESTLGTLAFIGGCDLLATAIIQRCPMNALLGINTCQ